MFEAVQKETLFHHNKLSKVSNRPLSYSTSLNLSHKRSILNLPAEYFEQTQFSDRCRPGV
ncbi:hypothetical protein SNR37_000630 [Agarivorans aestuarii]|uniref:Uncharacterized protein n=1 Tax=Agarivorans aestuarii TaxID=1563703 RepID=A0ABU7G7Q4_9ALTE|nr:hypothetical protein [Agarivorans aestuarii]MEE1675305.1 hypothetical protein [Agarivorans aestuarii]